MEAPPAREVAPVVLQVVTLQCRVRRLESGAGVGSPWDHLRARCTSLRPGEDPGAERRDGAVEDKEGVPRGQWASGLQQPPPPAGMRYLPWCVHPSGWDARSVCEQLHTRG